MRSPKWPARVPKPAAPIGEPMRNSGGSVLASLRRTSLRQGRARNLEGPRRWLGRSGRGHGAPSCRVGLVMGLRSRWRRRPAPRTMAVVTPSITRVGDQAARRQPRGRPRRPHWRPRRGRTGRCREAPRPRSIRSAATLVRVGEEVIRPAVRLREARHERPARARVSHHDFVASGSALARSVCVIHPYSPGVGSCRVASRSCSRLSSLIVRWLLKRLYVSDVQTAPHR